MCVFMYECMYVCVCMCVYVGVYVGVCRCRVAKFKRPRVLCDQKISEDNQKLRPGCPPDYHIFV